MDFRSMVQDPLTCWLTLSSYSTFQFISVIVIDTSKKLNPNASKNYDENSKMVFFLNFFMKRY